MRLYLDGRERNSTTCTVTPLTGVEPLTIAYDYGVTGGDYFNGLIDEVRIYNRSLSADEILAIYNSTRPNYISNHSLLRADSNGDYNYTYTTTSTIGNYAFKVNTTYNGMSAEKTSTLTVEPNAINISLNLNPSSTYTNRNISIYGHANDSDGTNVVNNAMNIYINDSLCYLNNNTGILENTTSWWNTSFSYRAKINITSLVSTNLNNTIILVNLSTSNLISQGRMNSECGDTRFVDSNGNELQYTIETSTCNSANTIYWVWANLTGNANTTIYAYYGNSAATLKTDYTNQDYGLAAYYHLDNSTAYGESSTKVYDFSKSGNNATLVATAVYNSSGRFGGGYSFDGDSDYLSVADPGTSTLDITGNITLMAWVYPRRNSSVNDEEGITGKRSDDTDNYHISVGTYAASDAKFGFNFYSTGWRAYYTDSSLALNTWHHVVATYNTSVVSLYVDGQLMKNYTGVTYPLITNNENFYIGSVENSYFYFNGSIDEVRIYNRTLSADEILAIYNSTVPSYINNYSLLSTDSNGDYNYTWSTATAGNYEIKANTTYNDVSAEKTSVLTVNDYYMNMTLNLNPNPAFTSKNVTIAGHINVSDGNNVSNNQIRIYINNSEINITAENTWNDWWNLSITNRTRIKIESLVSSNINNAIALVNFSTSGLVADGKVLANCTNIRFFDANSNELQHTLEMSTCNTSSTIFWVWTNLTGNANNTIYAYYDVSEKNPMDYTNPDDTLKLYLHFDNDTAYGETSTKIYDFSRNGNNGTINGATLASGGKYGKAYYFDGSNDYISTADNPLDFTGNFTVMTWVNVNESGDVQNILCKAEVAGYALSVNASDFASWSVHDGTAYRVAVSNSVINLNQWYHLTGVVNGTKVKLYVNGVLQSTEGTLTAAPTASTVPLIIGANQNSGPTWVDLLNGTVDEVRVYNRTLGIDEILAIYNSTVDYYANQTLRSTNDDGDYNYTITAPSTAGNYEIKVNTTYNSISAEKTSTLTVEQNAINISLNLNPSSTYTNNNINIYGHTNESDGTNVVNNAISIYINNTMYYYNNNTALLENTTTWWNTSYAYRTKINITSEVSTNLNNTIVLVNLSTSDLISQSKMQSDCDDTRFTDNNNNELQYTIETSTCNTNNTIYWVWINLTGNSNNTIYAYYGNSAATLKTDYTNPDRDLLMYLHFDNSSAYGESNSLVYDFSKNNNNGTPVNSPTYITGGGFGGAYNYTTGSDYMNITYVADDIPAAGSITLTAWVMLNTNTTEDQYFFSANEAGTGTENYIIIGRDSSPSNIFLLGRATLQCNPGSFSFVIGQWHFIAVIINQSNTQTYSYADGSYLGNCTYLSIPTTARISLAQEFDGATVTNEWGGPIDEVRVYNRSLSSDEILSIYNSTRPNYIQNHSLPRTDNSGNYNYTLTAPSTTGNYEIKANTTYDGMNAEAIGTLVVQTEAGVGVNCTSYKCFIIRSSGNPIAIFDSLGAVDLRSTIIQSAATTPGATDFIIRNSTATPVAWVNASGNLFIKGVLVENTGVACSPPTGSFFILGNNSECVAYVNNTGDLWLKGDLRESVLT
jgi:hypothetical protein